MKEVNKGLTDCMAIEAFAGCELTTPNRIVAIGINAGANYSNSVSIGNYCKATGEHEMWVNGRKIEITPEEVDAVIDAFLMTKSSFQSVHNK